MPGQDLLVDIESAGRQRIAKQGLERYEISAYAKPGFSN